MPSRKLQLPSVGLEPHDDGSGVTLSGPLPQRLEWFFEAEFRRLEEGGTLTLQRVDVYPADHEIRDGRPHVRTVPAGGVTSSVLRAVPLAALLQELHAFRMSDGRSFIEWSTGVAPTDFKRRPRPGRAGRDDLDYARLARLYLELAETSRTPVADLASSEGYGRQTIADLLAEARRRGLLESAGRGRRGGRLTPRAAELLAEGGQR